MSVPNPERRRFVKGAFLLLLAGCVPRQTQRPADTLSPARSDTPKPPSTPPSTGTAPASPGGSPTSSATSTVPATETATNAPTTTAAAPAKREITAEAVVLPWTKSEIENAKNLFEAASSRFFTDFVVSDGTPNPASMLRVIRPESWNKPPRDTVSEGMGYGLILAVLTNRQEDFKKLLNYVNAHQNKNGLMPWHITPEGLQVNLDGNPDENAATDAELDIAYALILAGQKWNDDSLLKVASTRLNAIAAHCLDPSGLIESGDYGPDILHPDYFSPAYPSKFSTISNNPVWNLVNPACEALIQKIRNLVPSTQQNGLVPDSCDAGGHPIQADFGYDAVRYPVRQALALATLQNEPLLSSIREDLTHLNSFFESITPSKIVDGYSLDGKPVGKYHNNTFVGAALAASIVSSDSNYRQQILQEVENLLSGSTYFDTSVAALACLLFPKLRILLKKFPGRKVANHYASQTKNLSHAFVLQRATLPEYKT